MRLLKLVALVAMLAAAVTVAGTARADDGPSWGPEMPNFNLEVVLRPTAGNGFGLVTFRQPNDGAKVILLDTWVRDLLPNHNYLLQRAVDLDTPDGVCSSQVWAPLGTITTDDRGTGRAALSRDVTGVLTGREFDIHFRVFDPTTSAAALESDCYQYTVDGD